MRGGGWSWRCTGSGDLFIQIVALWHCDIRILRRPRLWRLRPRRLGPRGDVRSLLVASLVVCLLALSVLTIMPHARFDLSIYVRCLEEGGGTLRKFYGVRVTLHVFSHFVERMSPS